MKEGLLPLSIQLFAEGGEEKPETTVEMLLGEIETLKENTISKEEYNKVIEDNKKLTASIVNYRPKVKDEEKKETVEDVIKRCEARTNSIGEGNSYQSVKALVENHRDMQTIGLSVDGVDENVVTYLEGLLEESKGDASVFSALMDSRIRAK